MTPPKKSAVTKPFDLRQLPDDPAEFEKLLRRRSPLGKDRIKLSLYVSPAENALFTEMAHRFGTSKSAFFAWAALMQAARIKR